MPKITAADAMPGDGFGRSIDIDGDLAAVSSVRQVYIFERGERGVDRDVWREVANVAPPGGQLPSIVKLSGETAVVGAGGQVAIFDRNYRGRDAWGLVTTLVPRDPTGSLGAVAIDGDTLAVSDRPADLSGAADWSVRIFQRLHHGTQPWREVTTLLEPPGFPGPFAFGLTLGLSNDALVVGQTYGPVVGGGRVLVYERNKGGQNGWGLVTTLTGQSANRDGFDGNGFGSDLSLSGETAAVTAGEYGTTINMFERNAGGPDHWDSVKVVADDCCFTSVAIGGPLLTQTSRVWQHVGIYAKNEGQAGGWGPVATFQLSTGIASGGFGGFPSAIDGDTVLVGVARNSDAGADAGAVEVFVSDIDGDGVRDGIDACPRDPLNDRRCHRDVVVSPTVDGVLNVNDVQTTREGKDVVITETITNAGDQAIRNPFAAVTFSGNADILNADGGRKESSGGTISPDVGDGVLSPGEQMTVRIELREQGKKPSVVHITVHGDIEP